MLYLPSHTLELIEQAELQVIAFYPNNEVKPVPAFCPYSGVKPQPPLLLQTHTDRKGPVGKGRKRVIGAAPDGRNARSSAKSAKMHRIMEKVLW